MDLFILQVAKAINKEDDYYSKVKNINTEKKKKF